MTLHLCRMSLLVEAVDFFDGFLRPIRRLRSSEGDI